MKNDPQKHVLPFTTLEDGLDIATHPERFWMTLPQTKDAALRMRSIHRIHREPSP